MRRIRLVAIWAVVILGGWVLLSAVEAAHGDEASAKAKLAKKGIRANRSGFSLQEEAEFSKSVSAAYSLKRKFVARTKPQHSTGSDNEEADAQVEALTQQNQLLRNKLSQLNENGFPYRGEVVRQINEQIAANEKELALIQQTHQQSTKSVEELRQNEKSAGQAYVNQVIDARELADRLNARYAELNQDKEVAATLKEWNEAAHTSNALKPSRTFESTLKRLEALENKIVSEKVPLRQKGKSHYATVTINGEKSCEMAVDTAAPTLLLPYEVAVGAGAKVDTTSETKTIQTADGSKVQAKRVLLRSVRVGCFTAKNVSCDVFPAKITSAKAVLGMSFLGQFKVELNAGASELALMRTDADPTPARKKKKPTPKHTLKKSVRPIPSGDAQQ
jgi:clan AA aspartic protease (TIGR02281 family)